MGVTNKVVPHWKVMVSNSKKENSGGRCGGYGDWMSRRSK